MLDFSNRSPGLRLAVIGAGTMGRGIATVALQAGLATTLVDLAPQALEAARAAIQRRLQRAANPAAASMEALRCSSSSSAPNSSCVYFNICGKSDSGMPSIDMITYSG